MNINWQEVKELIYVAILIALAVYIYESVDAATATNLAFAAFGGAFFLAMDIIGKRKKKNKDEDDDA